MVWKGTDVCWPKFNMRSETRVIGWVNDILVLARIVLTRTVPRRTCCSGSCLDDSFGSVSSESTFQPKKKLLCQMLISLCGMTSLQGEYLGLVKA